MTLNDDAKSINTNVTFVETQFGVSGRTLLNILFV